MGKSMQSVVVAVLLVLFCYGCVPVVVDRGEQEPEFIAPVVEFNEPCYLPPPFVVGYPYDYYTYENVGGFVNVVFWRNGQRFHHERWMENGQHMRAEHLHAWAASHRVERKAMEHHRAQLERRHNIRHDDAHFGLRPAAHAQKDSRRNPNMRKRPDDHQQGAQQAQRPDNHPQRGVQQAQRPDNHPQRGIQQAQRPNQQPQRVQQKPPQKQAEKKSPQKKEKKDPNQK